jgi:tRNA-splicing ligase RtcB
MFEVTKEDGAAPIKNWSKDTEASAMRQLKNIARLPFLAKNGVAAMADCHAGVGSTIGSVVATTTAIVPSMAGVDLGCGVIAVLTTLTASDLPESLLKIRQQIERNVPNGNSAHKTIEFAKDRLKAPPLSVINALGIDGNALDRIAQQLGTLGGGNHFIEICLDQQQRVWVMLHSGSRGIGNKIGRYYIDKAKEECARWHVDLPHADLAYLPEGSQFFDDYMAAVEWAQAYAFENRKLMLELVLAAMRRHLPPFDLVDEAISCHHNYIARENHGGQNLWVTRKGAVRARRDDLGVIPGSMGQRSYIVRGKANPESYCSCSHGAGRAMSRTEARKRFTVADLAAQTEGVECRKDDAILDEAPGSYKDIDEVMRQQADLVDVVAVLKQVLCVKGA